MADLPDLNPVLAEARQAMEAWEQADGWAREHDAARTLTECFAVIDDALRHGAELPMDWQTFRTRAGRVLSSADIEALAEEAERGYDVHDEPHGDWGGPHLRTRGCEGS